MKTMRTVPMKEFFYEPTFNRAIYFGVGYAFGRDANYGLGPRVAFRSTFMNVPHSWVPTGHFGWTFQIGGHIVVVFDLLEMWI